MLTNKYNVEQNRTANFVGHFSVQLILAKQRPILSDKFTFPIGKPMIVNDNVPTRDLIIRSVIGLLTFTLVHIRGEGSSFTVIRQISQSCTTFNH